VMLFFDENIIPFLALPTPSTPLFTYYAWSIWRCCTLFVVVSLIMVQVFVVAHVFILRTSLTHRQMLLIWLMGYLHPRCLVRHPLPWAWRLLPDCTVRPTLCHLVRPQCPRRLMQPRQSSMLVPNILKLTSILSENGLHRNCCKSSLSLSKIILRTS
jgi:hypothetical protein